MLLGFVHKAISIEVNISITMETVSGIFAGESQMKTPFPLDLCCRSDGSIDDDLVMPFQTPFILIKVGIYLFLTSV